MSDPMSDALFGMDGTELPEPLPSPLERGGSGLPTLTLPALPDSRMTREEVAAVLGEDSTWPGDEDPDAAPDQRGAAPPGAPPADTPAASASPAGAPPVAVTAPGHPSRPATPMLVSPRVPTPPGKSGVLRYHPTLPVGPGLPGESDLRRRAGRRLRPSAPPHLRSNGGATLFFLLTFVVSGVLMYGIIVGIVASLVRLMP